MASRAVTGAKGKTVELDAAQVPVPERDTDEHMEHRSGAKRAPPVGEAGSPSKQRAGQVTVDIETLRGLLAEQSSALLDKVMTGQKAQLQELAGDLRKELKTKEESVRAESALHAGEIKALKAGQDALVARLDKIEAKGGTSSASMSTVMEASNSDRHRCTLVFGGWPRDCPRKTITDQVHQALRECGLASLSDNPAFCTGPRRSMCLMQFRTRTPNEDFVAMRERMGKIVTGINQNNVLLRGGRRLWCSYSKTKVERDRGSHGALVRRTIRAVAPCQEEDLELEYATGSAWLGEFKLSSATLEPEEAREDELQRFDSITPGGPRPWINLTAISHAVSVDVNKVRQAVLEQVRR